MPAPDDNLRLGRSAGPHPNGVMNAASLPYSMEKDVL
jgi:hypothetical protein